MSTADIAGRLLRWKQNRTAQSRCLLRSHDAEVVSLTSRATSGAPATGESAPGSWTLKRVGSFSTRIAVGAAASDSDLAVYTPNTWSGGGTLAFRDGRSIRISTNSWQTSLDRVAG